MENAEKRFAELSERARDRCYTTFSEFLNMDEISTLASLRLNIGYSLWGGYDGAERCVAAFGQDCDHATFPVCIITVKPKSKKFSEKLTHRDFLGSLMGLGIKREMIGDIVVSDNTGYVMCLDKISKYIIQNLVSVRRTTVCCELADALPENTLRVPEESRIAVASERLDVLVSAIYRLSRNEAKEYFLSHCVFVNSRICENLSYIPKTGDVISVRGSGRFIYNGVTGKTRKNRLMISAIIYK